MENPLGKGFEIVVDDNGKVVSSSEVSKDGKKVKDVVIVDRAEYDQLVADSKRLRELEIAGYNPMGFDNIKLLNENELCKSKEDITINLGNIENDIR